MAQLRAYFGQPILSPDVREIWGFWAEDRVFFGDGNLKVQFKTLHGMLQIPVYEDNPEPMNRMTYVRYNNDRWIAGPNCVQGDFTPESNPWFLSAEFTGPDAVVNAIDVLLKSNEFVQYFSEMTTYHMMDGGLSEKMKVFRDYMKQRRKRLY